MGLVDIHDGIIFLGCLHHWRQVGHITGHAEDAIHDNETARLIRDALESVAKSIHRVVTVGNQLGWGYLTPLDNGGMVLAVAKDEVIGLGQGGKGTLVGKESGGKKQSTFAAKESSQRLLQFIMEGDRAIEQAGTGASGTKLASRLTGRLDNTGILGQAEVVIRPDHDFLLTAADNMVPVALLDAAEIRVESLSSGICRIAILSALLEEVSGHCFLLGKSQESSDV